VSRPSANWPLSGPTRRSVDPLGRMAAPGSSRDNATGTSRGGSACPRSASPCRRADLDWTLRCPLAPAIDRRRVGPLSSSCRRGLETNRSHPPDGTCRPWGVDRSGARARRPRVLSARPAQNRRRVERQDRKNDAETPFFHVDWLGRARSPGRHASHENVLQSLVSGAMVMSHSNCDTIDGRRRVRCATCPLPPQKNAPLHSVIDRSIAAAVDNAEEKMTTTGRRPGWASRRPLARGPGERLSVDELHTLQLERLQWTLKHTYDNVPAYRAKVRTPQRVRPEDCQTSSLANSRSPPSRTCATTIRSHVRRAAGANQAHPRIHGTTARTVVGYTDDDLDMWAGSSPSIRRGGGRPGTSSRLLRYGLFTAAWARTRAENSAHGHPAPVA